MADNGRDASGENAPSDCTRNLESVVRLTREMLALADEGDRDRTDSACGIIYGILRDSAYKLRKLAEEEIVSHSRAGR